MISRSHAEERLRAAFAVLPSAEALETLDRRVAAAAATAMEPGSVRARLGRLVRPLALVAAFVIAVGATSVAVGLLEGLTAPVPGLRVAWDRATRIGTTQTDGGYAITLERAYADLGQVVVGLSITRPDGSLQSGIVRSSLLDPTGRELDVLLSAGTAESGIGADVSSFGRPSPIAGGYALTVTSIDAENGAIEGRWAFTFELPAPRGTAVRTDVTGSAGSALVRVDDFLVSPTTIQARLRIKGPDSDTVSWAPIGRIVRGSESFPIAMIGTLEDTEEGTLVEVVAVRGVDDPTGTWVIEVSALVGNRGEEQVRIAGPWRMTVEVP